jgi:hypothetical protein
MSRRIIFVGGAQTRALARIFRAEVAGDMGDEVAFIGTGAVGTDQARAALLLADLVATEIDEDGDAVPGSDLPATAELVRIPNLYADYLWPFAGRPHPKNRGQFALPGGPYPSEQGDRFLDDMVAQGIDEDTAIRRYLNIDIQKEGELDSRLEDRMAIQRRLDGLGGFDLTPFIAARFRVEPLFRTRSRITMPLLRRLVGQLFPKLGAKGYNPEQLRRVPFPASALPVHPAVAAHFDLAWVGENQTYPVNEEGFFTFQEYCRRYMRFAWNEALHRGIQTAKSRPADAIADLEEGLQQSPDSPLGQRALAVARHAAGLTADAPADALIDEESYDPAQEGVPPVAAPPAASAPEAPAAVAPEPEPAPDEAAAEPATAVVADAPAEAELATTDASAEAAESPAPEPEPEAAPQPEAALPPVARFGAPAKPANFGMTQEYRTTEDGFTDFGTTRANAEPAETGLAPPGSDLIDVLPRLLPVFKDLSGASDRPFSAMPEVMPPPPLRPILPPELQGEPPKQGLLARVFGKKN